MTDDFSDAKPLAAHGRVAPAVTAISTTALLRMQGYRDLARVRPRIQKMAEAAAAAAHTLVTPVAHYRRARIAGCTAEALRLETGTVFHSGRFAASLAGCAEVVAFVLTLGPGLDDEVAALTGRDDPVGALFLETAGWLAIEGATKQLAVHLWAGAGAEGLRLSRRLAPGYADWPLAEQAPFFALFAGIDLPVRLLESSVMVPKKSRSGLYGLAPAAPNG